MPERLVPISRKQHDAFNNLAEATRANQAALQTLTNTLLMALDDDLGEVAVHGVRHADGVYALVIEVPDIAPAVEVEQSA